MNGATRWIGWATVFALYGSVAAPLGGAAEHDPPEWVVYADDPGPNLPPVGRSLFDHVFTTEVNGRRVYDIPYPFRELVARLVSHGDGTVRAVLIPFGRSLQRSAASNDYFGSPRIVVAVTGVGRHVPSSGHAPLGDRLFAGYQERAGVIEVISYNEAAARFEFQVVQDYRPEGRPWVGYADRGLCSRCHQNTGPIFPRPLWDETNANADVAARLEAVAEEFHGVPATLGVDVPDAIDAATDRATALLLHQKIWTEGCAAAGEGAIECRAELALEVLRYALSERRHDRSTGARHRLTRTLARAWPKAWPAGLAVPDPDIPNRRLALFAPGLGPLDLPRALGRGRPLTAAEVSERSSVPFELEPFLPRPPREVKHSFAPADVDALVDSLASFLSARDVESLDDLLKSRGRKEAVSTWKTSCRVTEETGVRTGPIHRRRIVCGEADDEASLALHARVELAGGGEGPLGRGRLDHLTLPGHGRLRHRALGIRRDLVSGGWLLDVPGTFRTARGDAVRRVALIPTDRESAALEVEVVHDFRLLEDALAGLVERTRSGTSPALGGGPFRRDVLMGAVFECLGGAYASTWPDLRDMPPAMLATNAADLDPAGTLPPDPEGRRP